MDSFAIKDLSKHNALVIDVGRIAIDNYFAFPCTHYVLCAPLSPQKAARNRCYTSWICTTRLVE